MSAAAALKRKKSYHSSAVPISAPMATLFASLTLSSWVALNSAAAVGLFRSLLSPSRVGDSVTSRELVELFRSPDRRIRPASHDTHPMTLQSVPGLIPDAFVAEDRCVLVHMHIFWGDG